MNGEGKKVLYLETGETGYESFYIDEYAHLDRMVENGWVACAGCDNYARLKVPAKDMKRALTELGLM